MNSTRSVSPFDAPTVTAVLVAGRQLTSLLCDRWTWLILLSALAGDTRFSEFRDRWGISTRLLGARLAVLEEQEVLVRLAYSRRPLRHSYHLTHMGLALFDVFASLLQWEQSLPPENGGILPRLSHLTCQHEEVHPVCQCAACQQPVHAHEVDILVHHNDIPALPDRSTAYRRSAPREAPGEDAPATPLARVLDIYGDKWTIEIIMCAFVRVSSFSDLQAYTGMSTNVLSDRLSRLVGAGVLQQERLEADARRLSYRLTDRGRGIFPIALTMWEWADTWLKDRVRAPIHLRHRSCGHALTPRMACDRCGQVLQRADCRFSLPAPAG